MGKIGGWGRASGFAARLLELRAAAGLSQVALAKAAGCRQSTIARTETGKHEPNWQLVLRLADALGVSTEAFRCTPAERVP